MNFWDKADLVSGSLETQSNRRLVDLAVDNHEIASLGFPLPGRSHSAYFEHRDVLRILFQTIYDGAHSFSTAPLVERKGVRLFRTTDRERERLAPHKRVSNTDDEPSLDPSRVARNEGCAHGGSPEDLWHGSGNRAHHFGSRIACRAAMAA